PQMSASSTPTVNPWAATATARLTVTDDLPTPPLPDAIATTLVVGGTAVSGARSWALRRARLIVRAFSSAVSSVQLKRTADTPGIDSTRVRASRWIWARSGQPAVVRAMVTRTSPPGFTSTPLTMPRSTMSLPSSGSMTPRSIATMSSGVGAASSVVAVGGAAVGRSLDSDTPAFYRSAPCKLPDVADATPAAPRSTDRPPRLAILKALGDNTRYAIYLELARSPAPRSTADIAATLDLHVNTVRPHLERMREVG